MTEFFKVNGKTISPPTELTVSPEQLDKVERTLDGTMVVDIIGMKRKVDLTWNYMSKEDMSTLAKETTGGGFVQIIFHDNVTGELITMTARAENLAYMPHYDWAGGRLMWKTVSVSFKEK